jgi:hypothetical protein
MRIGVRLGLGLGTKSFVKNHRMSCLNVLLAFVLAYLFALFFDLAFVLFLPCLVLLHEDDRTTTTVRRHVMVRLRLKFVVRVRVRSCLLSCFVLPWCPS